MLTSYSASLYTVFGDQVVTAKYFQKVQPKLVLKVFAIQCDHIFLYKTKGSSFTTERDKNLISPIPHFQIFSIEKLSLILPLDPHWGPNPLFMIIFTALG